jgi:GntR family transcriptional regulator
MGRVPLYKAAETELVRRIRSGEWEVGRRLPNEFVLAEEFGVSQGTMRRALMSLEGMGLLSRKPGRGTLVSAPRPAPNGTEPGGMALIGPDGAPPEFEPYRSRAATRAATAAEADLFGAARVATLDRTLRRDGSRVALDAVAVPEARLPALDEAAAVPLADLLAEADMPAARIEDRVTAMITSMSDSVALACARYTPLMILTRTAFDAEGHAMARQILRAIADDLAYGPA